MKLDRQPKSGNCHLQAVPSQSVGSSLAVLVLLGCAFPLFLLYRRFGSSQNSKRYQAAQMPDGARDLILSNLPRAHPIYSSYCTVSGTE